MAAEQMIGAGSKAQAKDVTTADFTREVLEASGKQPVIALFWSPRSAPSKQFITQCERAAVAAGGALKLAKMNIDDHPAIAGQLGIRSVPAAVAFAQGRAVDALMGQSSPAEISAFVGRLTGAEEAQQIDEMLNALDEMVKAGRSAEAAQHYAQILQQMPDNERALAGLAQCFLSAGQADKAKSLLENAPVQDKQAFLDSTAVKGILAKITLAEQTAHLPAEAELLKKLEADAKDRQALFDLSLRYNAEGKRDKAAEALLKIIRADREWHEDGARKQLLQFFEAWGLTDPATLTARRQLSSLLFS